MARNVFLPTAKLNLLPENATQALITPRLVILHSAVDAPGTTDLRGYFNSSGITVESHFWVPLNGRTEQFVSGDVRADANTDANRFALSVETEDEGNPNGMRWTPDQVRAITAICLWANATFGVPLRKANAWDGYGIGYHSQFNTANSRAGQRWTDAIGKTCPGTIRIQQFHEELLPSLTPTPFPQNQEDEEMIEYIQYCYRAAGSVGDTTGPRYWFHQVLLADTPAKKSSILKSMESQLGLSAV